MRLDARMVGSLVVVMAFIMGFLGSAGAESLTVQTAQGKARGKAINDGKVKAFLGLPYAAPPVGDLRWKAPQPPANWIGERDATKYGAHCAQNQVFDDMVFEDGEGSENCLFLNIYAPAHATNKSRLPVMFWIHGGGFVGGASSEPRHNGDFLPLKGVVLITINYRLGVFGFLATQDLAQEANGASGNYGLLDMVAALQWVKSNIREFGGNPDNVTIFGESAGSAAVSTLMASPLAKGLFQRAIGESGGALGEGLLDYQPASARGQADGEWVAKAGAKNLKDLRAMPTAVILEAAKTRGMVGFGPDIDGRLLVEPVEETYAEGRQAHVPLLAGWNRDEGNFSIVGGMTAEKFKANAAGMFKERADEFLKLYPADNDEQATRSAIDFGSDQFIAFGTWKWLEAHRKTGQSPVYRYRFELAAPPSKFHPGSFAFHSDDIEYVFGTLDTRPGAVWRAEDRKLSEEIMGYWTNFAKNGNPNGAGLPEWPRYGAGDELIYLDRPINSGPDTLRPRYEFLLKGMPPIQF